MSLAQNGHGRAGGDVLDLLPEIQTTHFMPFLELYIVKINKKNLLCTVIEKYPQFWPSGYEADTETCSE